MARFGSFETEREVYSDPIYTVYSAKKPGEVKAQYALKVFSIQSAAYEPETSVDLAPLLMDLESARLHCIDLQAHAAVMSRFISPVFEKGQDERGVWYVTRFYPRSVNKIILGKVALTGEALAHLIRCIVQGALDFKRACGRSHGNILPSNVQLSGGETLNESQVVISDPMPGGDEESADFEINDLRGIGRIVLQLVEQRAMGNEEEFLILPILSSPQWTGPFGKDSEAWLGLCNRLLDPNLSLQQMTLDRLAAELDGLQPKTSLSPKWLIAAAAGFLLVGFLALALLRPRSQVISVTSDPPGATILVDEKDQRQTTPCSVRLKPGTHKIEARNPILGSAATNWTVSHAGSLELSLKFAYGILALTSDPAGAEVELDGKAVGPTPYRSGPLPPGERSFTLSLPNYEQYHGSIAIPSDGRVLSAPVVKLNRRNR
jgi:hypothetical protein